MPDLLNTTILFNNLTTILEKAKPGMGSVGKKKLNTPSTKMPKILGTSIPKTASTALERKPGVIGERRTWGGNEYEKTADGWVFVKKGREKGIDEQTLPGAPSKEEQEKIEAQKKIAEEQTPPQTPSEVDKEAIVIDGKSATEIFKEMHKLNKVVEDYRRGLIEQNVPVMLEDIMQKLEAKKKQTSRITGIWERDKYTSLQNLVQNLMYAAKSKAVQSKHLIFNKDPNSINVRRDLLNIDDTEAFVTAMINLDEQYQATQQGYKIDYNKLIEAEAQLARFRKRDIEREAERNKVDGEEKRKKFRPLAQQNAPNNMQYNYQPPTNKDTIFDGSSLSVEDVKHDNLMTYMSILNPKDFVGVPKNSAQFKQIARSKINEYTVCVEAVRNTLRGKNLLNNKNSIIDPTAGLIGVSKKDPELFNRVYNHLLRQQGYNPNAPTQEKSLLAFKQELDEDFEFITYAVTERSGEEYDWIRLKKKFPGRKASPALKAIPTFNVPEMAQRNLTKYTEEIALNGKTNWRLNLGEDSFMEVSGKDPSDASVFILQGDPRTGKEGFAGSMYAVDLLTANKYIVRHHVHDHLGKHFSENESVRGELERRGMLSKDTSQITNFSEKNTSMGERIKFFTTYLNKLDDSLQYIIAEKQAMLRKPDGTEYPNVGDVPAQIPTDVFSIIEAQNLEDNLILISDKTIRNSLLDKYRHIITTVGTQGQKHGVLLKMDIQRGFSDKIMLEGMRNTPALTIESLDGQLSTDSMLGGKKGSAAFRTSAKLGHAGIIRSGDVQHAEYVTTPLPGAGSTKLAIDQSKKEV